MRPIGHLLKATSNGATWSAVKHVLARPTIPYLRSCITSGPVNNGLVPGNPPTQPALPAMWDLLYSISTGWKSTGPPLSLGEMLWGARVLAKQQANSPRDPRDSLPGTPVTDRPLLHHLVESLDMAAAAYKKDRVTAAAMCKLKVHDILVWRHEGSYLAPGYFIALDHGNQEVVWVIRGTRHMSDLITDLSTAHPYMQGHTHWGMQQGAHWMLNRESNTVRECLKRYPGYRLHLTGHSMGGGVAALMAHMAHTQPQVVTQLLPHGKITIKGVHQVYATCFATPCIMSRDMALSCRPYVSSVVLGDDLVPRLNAQTAGVLRSDLRATDWRPRVASLLGVQQWYADQVKHVSALVRPPVEALQHSLPPPVHVLNTLLDSVQASNAGRSGPPLDNRLIKTTQGRVAEMFTTLLQPFLPPPLMPPPPPPASPRSRPATAGDDDSCGLVASDGHDDAALELSMKAHVRGDALYSLGGDGGETDLGRWSQRWRQAVHAATQQLSDLRAAPLAAREAFFTALSSPGSDDLVKQIKLLMAAGASLTAADTAAKPGDVPVLKSLASRVASKLDDMPFLRALVSEVLLNKGKSSSSSSSRQASAASGLEGNVVRSDGDDVDVFLGNQEAQAAAAGAAAQVSMPLLYPAGQLYYIERTEHAQHTGIGTTPADLGPPHTSNHGSGGDGSGLDGSGLGPAAHPGVQAAHLHHPHHQPSHAVPVVRVLSVPPDAEFFGRVLITVTAFRDHRSKSYRSSLYAALDRELTQQ